MTVPGDDLRDEIFRDSRERLEEMASRAVFLLDRDPRSAAVVAIHVDDPSWRHLADMLMPETDWQAFRDRGEEPIARGSVTWEVVEYICQICPDVSGMLERETRPGCLYALVLAAQGASVYEVSYIGAGAEA